MAIELLLPKPSSQESSDLENKLSPLPSGEEITNILSDYKKDLGNEYEPLLKSLISLTEKIKGYYAQLEGNDANKKKRRVFNWPAYSSLQNLDENREGIMKALQNIEWELNYHRTLLFGDDPTKEPLYELYLRVKYHAVRALGNDKQMEETLKYILISLNKKKASNNS